jgi:hypothetical protein
MSILVFTYASIDECDCRGDQPTLNMQPERRCAALLTWLCCSSRTMMLGANVDKNSCQMNSTRVACLSVRLLLLGYSDGLL